MEPTKITGKNNKHKVLIYTLSTCGWCKLTKKFLKDNDVEYEYIDVDLCKENERSKIRLDIQSRGGRLSYPTIIIDDKKLITGFYKESLAEALGI